MHTHRKPRMKQFSELAHEMEELKMVGLVFRNPQGIEGYTEATSESVAEEMKIAYGNDGYILVREFKFKKGGDWDAVFTHSNQVASHG